MNESYLKMAGEGKGFSGAIFDIIVVGAGVEGLATAFNCARNGYRTLLLEQFLLPHTRGSSHGQTRITRKSYADDFYVSMMQDAYQMWSDLEKEAEYPIWLKQSGVLTFGYKPLPLIQKMDDAMVKSGVVFERLNSAQLTARFPMMAFDGDIDAVYEPSGGVLKADSILQVYQRLFKKDGGIVNDGEKVESITPGDLVTVKTSRDTYKARSVVIATGPWASSLLKPLGINLPLKPERIRVCYWKQKTGKYSPEAGFPGMVMSNWKHPLGINHVYAIPAIEYPNHVKVCLHYGKEVDPDARDVVAMDTFDLDTVSKFVKTFLPGLEDKPSIVESCMYTVTPDENCILDTHPEWENVIFGVGFSGHGFKLAPVVGKVLSEMAMGRKVSYDLTPFRMARFAAKTPKARM